jgi:3-deoxy-manno-octulosonate cytidylyltransferase (CMP-KDO synthetase)
VVLDQQAQALYFSRAPIPYPRDAYQTLANQPLLESFDALRHMGIYAYRVGFLKQYGQLSVSPLEQLESLEQLRVLAHGYKIAVHISPNMAAQGVDLPEDVALVEAFLAQTGQ